MGKVEEVRAKFRENLMLIEAAIVDTYTHVLAAEQREFIAVDGGLTGVITPNVWPASTIAPRLLRLRLILGL